MNLEEATLPKNYDPIDPSLSEFSKNFAGASDQHVSLDKYLKETGDKYTHHYDVGLE